MALSYPPVGQAFGPFRQGRCRVVAFGALPRKRSADRAIALEPDADPQAGNDIPAGRSDHDDRGRRQHPGRHGRACLSHHQIDGGPAFLQCRWRDDVRRTAGRFAFRHGVRPYRHRARRDRGDPAWREIQGRDPEWSGTRLSLRELRWRFHHAGARPDRRELSRQCARLPYSCRSLRRQGYADRVCS